MSPFGYPVLVELEERHCVVIGALPVREGKVEGLLAGGATDVTVVATEPSDRLEELELLGGVRVVRRTWYASDFTGALLVIAHDPEPAVRARIAIGTGGASPALSKKIRERLQDEFGPGWAEVLRVLREVREETMPYLPDLRDRSRRWQLALDLDEADALIREGGTDELRARLRDRLLDGVVAT